MDHNRRKITTGLSVCLGEQGVEIKLFIQLIYPTYNFLKFTFSRYICAAFFYK